MGILENARRPKPNASGRWIVMPRHMNAQSRRRNRVIRRRRQSFVRLLGLAAVTLILGFVPHLRWILWVNLAADAAVGLYVWRLLEWKHREQQRKRVVTPIAVDDPHSVLDPGVGIVGHAPGTGRPIASSG